MEIKFNFKSQVCTDKNQSERLLALGLKKETADMFIGTNWGNELSYDNNGGYTGNLNTIIPAWSLHRLIEMMPENVTSDDWLGISFDDVSYYHGEGEGIIGWKFYKSGNLYDCIVDAYEWLIKKGYFNKEYLV